MTAWQLRIGLDVVALIVTVALAVKPAKVLKPASVLVAAVAYLALLLSSVLIAARGIRPPVALDLASVVLMTVYTVSTRGDLTRLARRQDFRDASQFDNSRRVTFGYVQLVFLIGGYFALEYLLID